jgi:hypothetical protein
VNSQTTETKSTIPIENCKKNKINIPSSQSKNNKNAFQCPMLAHANTPENVLLEQNSTPLLERQFRIEGMRLHGEQFPLSKNDNSIGKLFVLFTRYF